MEIIELKELTLFELVMEFEKILKQRSETTYRKYKESKLSKSNEYYILIDLKKWNTQSKELLLKSSMVGILNYYFNISTNKALNVGGFNGVMEVVNGREAFFLYIKSIKWIPLEILEKISVQGVSFTEFR
ncbi:MULTISPECIES: hypothetical protein [unclassified Polaribacter]|uniref:hypothetical protein n=1 Tax=unclassified Polaribacter TaxID=196858 RepID=UPI0011BE6156|nr:MULTISPECIES: hypothetical protein [unclassified Polaribacter]TXD53598.1 hypothetical protein ES043_02945 [Polaribacter sp. IC063]TXD62161.1 hypothetical protein ES044_02760 [Polaribacter sp. IC066]